MYRDLQKNTIQKNKLGCGIDLNSEDGKEFNDKLNVWIKKKNFQNRCLIIIGNYQCVGESNTFVHSDYSYVRSVILPPGCIMNSEKHYQFLLRGCFLL